MRGVSGGNNVLTFASSDYAGWVGRRVFESMRGDAAGQGSQYSKANLDAEAGLGGGTHELASDIAGASAQMAFEGAMMLAEAALTKKLGDLGGMPSPKKGTPSCPAKPPTPDPEKLFRGGSSLEPRKGIDYKVGTDGNVTERRISLNANKRDANIQKYGGAFEVDQTTIPDGLKAKNTGGTHYEIVPSSLMPEAVYLELMKQVRVKPYNEL